MKKSISVGLALAVVTVAITVPTLLALHLARTHGLETEAARALSYARDVVRRSDDTAEQIQSGINKLVTFQGEDPCADQHLALMREIDLGSTYIQAIGVTRGDTLVCSSLGHHVPPLELGAVDAVSPTGTTMRANVGFPFAPGDRFLVVASDGYAAIIHKNLPIDVSIDQEDIVLATFTTPSRKILAASSVIKPEWLNRQEAGLETTFFDGDHAAATVRSKRFFIGGVAALPLSHVDQRTRELAMILVPIGLAAGLVLAAAVLYIARLQMAMPAVLKTALKRKEFSLVYQPIVDLQSGKWVGAEALLRWRRPNGEFVRPDIFIPVAEDAGLIQKITERVMEIVARDAKGLFVRDPAFHIAINLSSADIQSPRTTGMVRELVGATGAGPDNLLVEVTERSFANPETARGVVHDIRANGVRIAIDDFGTGYSSLSYLETFELDFLKIDRAFVNTVDTDAPMSQVGLHIIEMSKSLKLGMIAEGVETEAQAQFLRARGVQFAQGWLFAKPMSMSDLLKRMRGLRGAN